MHMHKPRGLNIGESYACNRSAVRKCFESQDITIFWGNHRSHSFDFQMRKPPKIDGIVVASLIVNHRIQNPLQQGVLNFYILKEPQYNAAQKQTFEKKCLPLLFDWYCAHHQPQLRGGCDEMLAVWNAGRFQLMEIHFT